MPSDDDLVDVAVELRRVEHGVPRADHAVEQQHDLGPLVGGHVGRVDEVSGHRRGERVDRPVDAGLGVEEPAGDRGVEDRGAHGHERAVADVEGLAGVDPPHAVQRQLDRPHDALHGELGRDQGGVRAQLEYLGEVAGVVVVVVGEEHPPDVRGVDDENAAASHSARDSTLPVSTMTGSAAVMTIEFSGTIIPGWAGHDLGNDPGVGRDAVGLADVGGRWGAWRDPSWLLLGDPLRHTRLTGACDPLKRPAHR